MLTDPSPDEVRLLGPSDTPAIGPFCTPTRASCRRSPRAWAVVEHGDERLPPGRGSGLSHLPPQPPPVAARAHAVLRLPEPASRSPRPGPCWPRWTTRTPSWMRRRAAAQPGLRRLSGAAEHLLCRSPPALRVPRGRADVRDQGGRGPRLHLRHPGDERDGGLHEPLAAGRRRPALVPVRGMGEPPPPSAPSRSRLPVPRLPHPPRSRRAPGPRPTAPSVRPQPSPPGELPGRGPPRGLRARGARRPRRDGEGGRDTRCPRDAWSS